MMNKLKFIKKDLNYLYYYKQNIHSYPIQYCSDIWSIKEKPHDICFVPLTSCQQLIFILSMKN